MTFAIRGMIEGFYGRLWTWAERERVAGVVAAAGFDTYVYAPKEDRLQNAGWRGGYSPDDEHRLRAFGERCRSAGMDLWIGLRPVGISYAGDDDAAMVVERLRRYLELGAARVLLLADDIPGTLDASVGDRFASLAAAHAWLVDHVLRGLGIDPARLVFCPTDYHGAGSPYLEAIGAAIPAGVELCWTGPHVCSPSIRRSDAARIASILGRRPLLWDNYPVNDADMIDELHIGPIRHRAADLPDAVAGVIVNPALQPEATLVPLLTWADYLRDPAAYAPDASWRNAVLEVAGNEADADALGVLAAALDCSVIRQPWDQPPGSAVRDAARRVGHFENRALADELAPFVAAYVG